LFKNFGFSGKSEYFQSKGASLDNGFFIILTSVGTIVFGLSCAFISSYEPIVTWSQFQGISGFIYFFISNPIIGMFVGVPMLIVGAIGTYKDQNKQNKEIDKLKVENSELPKIKSKVNAIQEELEAFKSKVIESHLDLVANWLKGLDKILKLDNNDRVTIYYENKEEFYLLQRHSRNPKYKKVHRQKFPLNQGVISKAFEDGEYLEILCPSIDDSPDLYKQFLQDTYEYESDKIDKLTMNSCRYLSLAIIEADIHVGVIVFESTSKNFFDTDKAKKIKGYCKDHQGQLSKFVRDMLKLDTEVKVKIAGLDRTVESDIDQMLKK